MQSLWSIATVGQIPDVIRAIPPGSCKAQAGAAAVVTSVFTARAIGAHETQFLPSDFHPCAAVAGTGGASIGPPVLQRDRCE